MAPERFSSPNLEGFVNAMRLEDMGRKQTETDKDPSPAVLSPGSVLGGMYIISPSEASTTTGNANENSRASRGGTVYEWMDIFSAGCAIAKLFKGGNLYLIVLHF